MDATEVDLPNGARQARGAVTRTFEFARRKPRHLHVVLGAAQAW